MQRAKGFVQHRCPQQAATNQKPVIVGAPLIPLSCACLNTSDPFIPGFHWPPSGGEPTSLSGCSSCVCLCVFVGWWSSTGVLEHVGPCHCSWHHLVCEIGASPSRSWAYSSAIVGPQLAPKGSDNSPLEARNQMFRKTNRQDTHPGREQRQHFKIVCSHFAPNGQTIRSTKPVAKCSAKPIGRTPIRVDSNARTSKLWARSLPQSGPTMCSTKTVAKCSAKPTGRTPIRNESGARRGPAVCTKVVRQFAPPSPWPNVLQNQ